MSYLILLLIACYFNIISAQEDICGLPKVTGMCRGYFPSFYFNSETKQCESFIYGGCGGNGNRFETTELCQTACAKKDKINICNLPSVPGMCRAYIPSYFYNTQTGRCEQFIYGGCGGNENRFETLPECENACGAQKISDPCQPNPCGRDDICVPEPKQCFTTPCPQHRCQPQDCAGKVDNYDKCNQYCFPERTDQSYLVWFQQYKQWLTTNCAKSCCRL